MKPLVLEFEVAASRGHAFDIWANRISLWWPRDHTVSGSADVDIIVEGFTGGRIFERTVDGSEHDWGRVVEWDPPHRLAYTWHLLVDPGEATDLTVTFSEAGEGTSVRIEQRGWERLGAAGPPRREGTNRVWQTMIGRYVDACLRTAPR